MRVQERWLRTFESIFRRCQVAPGEVVRVLTETDSRAINVELAELALARLGAVPVRITVPSLPVTTPVPVRSTGPGPLVEERYEVTPLGVVSITLTDLDTGFAKAFQLGA